MLLFFHKGSEVGWPDTVKDYVLSNAICAHCGRKIHKSFHICRCHQSPRIETREYRLFNWTQDIEDICLTELRRTARRNYPSKARGKAKRSERMKEIQGGYNFDDIDAIREIQGNCCYYCGKPKNKLHIDHVIPISKNGTNYLFNIVLACALCNSIKGKSTVAEFWNRMKRRYGSHWVEHRKQAVKDIDQQRSNLESFQIGLRRYQREKIMT